MNSIFDLINQKSSVAQSNMPIFKLSTPYFAKKCIKFHMRPSRFEKKFPVPLLTGMGKERGGIKGFLPLKKGGEIGQGRGEREGREKERDRRASCGGE